MIFSRRLRRLRESAGLTISQLATAAKLPRQTIHLLESGQRQPSLKTARQLLRALGKSLAVLD